MFKRPSFKTFKFTNNIKWLPSWIGLNFLGLIIVFYFSLSSNTDVLSEQLQLQRHLLAQDIEKIYDNYFRELTYTKYVLEDIGLNKVKINAFFRSKQSQVIDKKNIGTIIITDRDFKVIYADNFDESNYNNLVIANRDYRNQISVAPDKIIVGKTVLGILTRTPSIPIVTGLKDKTGDFNGAAIFSINLRSLARNLEHHHVKQILINTEDNRGITNNFNSLLHKPKAFFFFDILLNLLSSELSFGFYLEPTKDIVEITYNLTKIRKDFYINYFLPHAITLIILLLIIHVAFNYYVLKPLLPAILTVNNKSNYNFRSQNIFSKVSELCLIQNSINETSKAEIKKEEKIRLSSRIIFSLADEITSKLEIASEDVEDILLDYSRYPDIKSTYLNTLKNVYEISLENKNEVIEVLNIMYRVINERNFSEKGLIDIYDLLVDMGIPAKLIIVNKLPQAISTTFGAKSLSGIFYLNLLTLLFQNILTFIEDVSKILSIEIKQENHNIHVNFLCEFKIDNDKAQALNLTKCRAWALVNGASLILHCTTNLTAISLKLSQAFNNNT